MLTTWKNKMIEHSFNYADSTIKEMTDIFETRVDNLEPNKEKKQSSAASKKRKREDSDSNVVESRKESTEASLPSKKYFILHRNAVNLGTVAKIYV